MREPWWVAPGVGDGPRAHALVVGVSRYDHLSGGTGPLTAEPMLAGLGQLSAAATSAVRVAHWLRDRFDYPDVPLATIRLAVSPSPGEDPLPGAFAGPAATGAEVRAALSAWRAACRSDPGNVSLLYVAGHGLQTSLEGGILLLQDVGAPDALTPLEHALDVASVRRGLVAEPGRADLATPEVQYFFYDACRVLPPTTAAYATLAAGITLDEPRGVAPRSSYVLWGSRSRDFALADPTTRSTLFSAALTDVLDRRAPTDPDGRTVRLAQFAVALEQTVQELAAQHGEDQQVVPGGAGPFTTPIHRRPAGSGDEVRTVHPLSALQPVTVNTGVRPAPYSILDVHGAVTAEAWGGESVEVFPGPYVARVALAWGGAAEASFVVDSAPVEVTVPVPEADPRGHQGLRVEALLGPSGGALVPWFLRFLTWTGDGLAPAFADVPLVEVDDFDGDTVAMLVHTTGPQLRYAQVRTEDGRSVVVALPAVRGYGAAPTCWLHARVTETALGAAVRGSAAGLDTLLGYATGPRPDLARIDAAAVGSGGDALELALAGYAALRVGTAEALIGVSQWVAALGRATQWLPDAAVVAGEWAARSGRQDEAERWYRGAADVGIPVFTDGLSYLAARAVPTDAGAAMRDGAARARYAAPVSTLDFDADPGPIEAEHGWRRFVPTRLAEDPRAFWRQP